MTLNVRRTVVSSAAQFMALCSDITPISTCPPADLTCCR